MNTLAATFLCLLLVGLSVSAVAVLGDSTTIVEQLAAGSAAPVAHLEAMERSSGACPDPQ